MERLPSPLEKVDLGINRVWQLGNIDNRAEGDRQ